MFELISTIPTLQIRTKLNFFHRVESLQNEEQVTSN